MTMGVTSKDIPDTASVHSSSSSEKMDAEGRIAIKDIEKLTGDHLDVKPLELDLGNMRKYVHTPKNGVKIPMDLISMVEGLQSDGFLVISPENRPAQVV